MAKFTSMSQLCCETYINLHFTLHTQHASTQTQVLRCLPLVWCNLYKCFWKTQPHKFKHCYISAIHSLKLKFLYICYTKQIRWQYGQRWSLPETQPVGPRIFLWPVQTVHFCPWIPGLHTHRPVICSQSSRTDPNNEHPHAENSNRRNIQVYSFKVSLHQQIYTNITSLKCIRF